MDSVSGYGRRMRAIRTAISVSTVFACVGTFTLTAQAQDRVYWSNFLGNAISSANADGSGVGAHLNMNSVSGPTGTAFDPARGRIYWSSWSTGKIMGANLDDPSSATELYSVGQPYGIQIDAASQTLYWTDSVGSKVVSAPADGSGPVKTLFVDPNQPSGVSIDPARGKIYWANFANGFPLTGKISVGAIDGSGIATVLYSALDGPSGIAIDPSTNTLWTTMQEDDTIKRSTLDGSGPLGTIASSPNSPDGVAADLNGGNLFWANVNPDSISKSSLTGSDVSTLNTSPVTPDEPLEPVLLEDPNATSAPEVSGTKAIGSQLSCTQGGWATDNPGAKLYQAPRSFSYQWQRNDTSVAGATNASFVPDQGGSYACVVTATNYSGSTTQTTAAVAIADAPATSTPTSAVTTSLAPLTLGFQPPGLRHNACVTRTPKRKSFSVTYSVSTASRVEAVLYFRKRSKRLRGSCKSAQSSAKPKVARKWTFTAAAGNGKVKIPFKLKGKLLKVGRYTLSGVAVDSAGKRSKAAGTTFFIIPAK